MSESKEIKSFKTKIANAKRKLTNFKNFIDAFDPVVDFPILEKRKRDFDREFANFEKLYSELEELEEDPSHAWIQTEYEEIFYTARGKANSLSKGVESFTTDSSTGSVASNSITTIQENSARIKKGSLPRLNIPTFSGNYDFWLGCHDLFKSIVDNDKDLPDIEKLYGSFIVNWNVFRKL